MDIDTAVEREMARKATSEPTEVPKNGECAVCGRPVTAAMPPRKDPNTPRFCDEHDSEDLQAMERTMAVAQDQLDPMSERYRRH